MIKQPVMPSYGQGVVVTPAAASATQSNFGKGAKQVVLTNSGANICHVQTFNSVDGAIVATTADFPVLPNAQVTITKDEAHDSIAYISAVGTTLHMIPAEGF